MTDRPDPADEGAGPVSGSPDRDPHSGERDFRREDEAMLESRLVAQRPVPRAGFRGALGRRVAVEDSGLGPRPPHLRARVAVYLAAGGAVGGAGVLIALGVL
jgi:hypothetical protein